MVMDKLIVNTNQIPSIASTPKLEKISQYEDQQDSTSYFHKIIDRVTISNKAKLMSQRYADIVRDNATPSILSYEIRKPFTIYGTNNQQTILDPRYNTQDK
jgi:hypothetical protein